MATDDDDLTNLVELSEETILERLSSRYGQGFIYTYCGTILIAMNPYQSLNCYGPQYIQSYASSKMNDLAPHIYAIAQAAYSNMKRDGDNQSVIISGESGAGKTESTKLILNFLTSVSKTDPHSSNNDESWIEQQILEANVILESFGNAKTVRNNNSSRFGKFVQVLFDAGTNNQIVGASMINYLLEKSRITQQAQSERNYHIFYQLVLGCSEEERARYSLYAEAESYRYLNQSGCISLADVDEARSFSELKVALTVLKMNPEHVDSLFTVLSAILLLGNVTFHYDQQKEKNEIADPSFTTQVARMLEIDEAALNQALCYRKLFIRGETSLVPLKDEAASDSRDSIAKYLYNNIFQFIVQMINKSTESSATASARGSRFIGVLDIFGFENFKVNSLEQLFINYANEKLQQFFNQYIFKLEQEEYNREGIAWNKVDFKDNQMVIDTIESKLGFMSLLDEECRFPKGTDDSFLAKINESLNSYETYIKPRTMKGAFGIKHYAGEVIYEVKGFLDKNKDSVQDEVAEMFLSSKSSFIQEIFAGLLGGNDKKSTNKGGTLTAASKKTTASSNFKGQLNQLVATLGSTVPHYVRCLKPNSQRKAFLLENDLTLAQLRYSGMLETIRIRKAGFPFRYQFSSFINKFKCLIHSSLLDKGASSNQSAIISYVMTSVIPENLRGNLVAGKSKVFMRTDAFFYLQKMADARWHAIASSIQKSYRGYRDRRRYLLIRKACQVLQRYTKGFCARLIYHRQKIAVLKLQKCARGFLCRLHLRREAEAAALRYQQEQEALAAAEAASASAAAASAISAPEIYVPEPGGSIAVFDDSNPSSRIVSRIAGSGSDEVGGRIVSIAESEFDPEAYEIDQLTKAAQQKMRQVNSVQEEDAGQSGVESAASAGLAPMEPESPSKGAASNALDDLFSFLDEFQDEEKLLQEAGDATNAANGAPSTKANKDAKNMEKFLELELDDIFGNELKEISNVLGELSTKAGTAKEDTLGISDNSSTGERKASFNSANALEVPSGSAKGQGQSATANGIKVKPVSPGSSNLNVSIKKNGLGGTNPQLIKKTEDFRFTDFPIEVYAEKVINLPESVAFDLKKKVALIGEIMTNSRTLNDQPMLKLPTKELVNNALEIFKMLVKIHDIPRKKGLDDMIAPIGKITQYGIKNQELRDEIYFQLMKMCNLPANNNEGGAKSYNESVLNIWNVLICCCSCFPPSKALYKYLLAFMMKKSSETDADALGNELSELSARAENNLKVVFTNGPRKIPLFIQEINSILTDSPIVVKVFLMDGQMKTANIAPTLLVGDVVKDVTKNVGLKESTGWGIFERINDDYESERFIKSNDYISDIVADWENIIVPVQNATNNAGNSVNPGSAKGTRSKPGTMNKSNGLLFESSDGRKLVLKRRVIKNLGDNNTSSDPIEYHLNYAQAAIAVLRNDYGVTEKIALQLAGLKAQIEWNDVDPNQRGRFKKLSEYIPTHIINNQSSDAWINGIIEAQTKLKGKTIIQCKVLYLETVKQFKLYGSTLFEVTYEGFWSFSDKVFIAASCTSLYIVHHRTKNILATYSADQVANWQLDSPKKIYLLLRKSSKSGDSGEIVEHLFSCEKAEEMSLLFNEYYSSYKSSKAVPGKKKADGLMSGQMQLKAESFEKDEVQIRDNLILSRILRLPGPDTLSKQSSNRGVVGLTFRKNNTIKSTVFAVEMVKQSNVVDKEILRQSYTKADWSFSKAKLTTSIIYAEDDEVEFIAQASNLCVVLQIYAGLLDVKNMPIGMDTKSHQFSYAPPHTNLIQTILFNMISNPKYCGECYLQLIRQTCNPPEPDGKTVIAYWNFMMLAVSCTFPPVPLILDYLKCHLMKVSLNGAGNGKQEAKMASHCLKLLSRTLTAQPGGLLRRQLPPSVEEIKAILQMREVITRFYSADGQFRALPFDSVTTVNDIYEMLTDRLKLGNKDEYALYERFEEHESRLDNQLFMGDLLFKWEKFVLTPADPNNHAPSKNVHEMEDRFSNLRFMIKKRLYLNPFASSDNEVEEALILFQAQQDVRSERHPLDENESVTLASLKIQIDMGDQNFRKLPSYEPMLEKHFPRSILNNPAVSKRKLTENLENAHGSLKGLSTADCNKRYLEVIRKWPYHGSAFFDVEQTYTNEFPKSIVLAVNFEGIHLFQKGEKVPLKSYPFVTIAGFSPSDNYLLVIVEDGSAKASKSLFLTNESMAIAHLIKDYITVLTKYTEAARKKNSISRGPNSLMTSEENNAQ